MPTGKGVVLWKPGRPGSDRLKSVQRRVEMNLNNIHEIQRPLSQCLNPLELPIYLIFEGTDFKVKSTVDTQVDRIVRVQRRRKIYA